MESYKLTNKGIDYVWEPSKSTPSCKNLVNELPMIVDFLKSNNVKSIIDFGCGTGRNSKMLYDSFQRLLLVECKTNVEKLKSDPDFAKFEIMDYETFEKRSEKNYESVLLSFVLHTLPNEDCTQQILKRIKSNLKDGAYLAIISPKNDSKYTSTNTANFLKVGDGYVKTLKGGKYSYYKNLNQSDIKRILSTLKVEIVKKIFSASRNIIIFKLI